MDTRYLIVSGTITADDTIELVPGFLTSQPPREAIEAQRAIEEGPPDDAIVVESLGADDTVLGREAIATEPLCLEPPEPGEPQMVSGLLTFNADTKRLRFIYHNQVLREIEVPERPPTVKLEWRPDDEVSGQQSVAWQARHPFGADMAFIVLFSHAADEWRPVSLVLHDNVASVDFDALPGGEACRIRVLASDGVNTASADSPPFRVGLKGLEPLIVHPDDGDTVPAQTPVLLEGIAMDWESGSDETIPLRWRSSIDGELGEGETIERLLSSGLHEITLAVGTEGQAREASISISVAGA